MRQIFILLILLLSSNCFSQKDSINTKNPYYLGPRFSLGIQNSPFIEIGISKHNIHGGLELSSNCFYTAAELNKRLSSSNSDFFYGLKLGYETGASGGMIAFEAKYITDFTQDRFIVTPKIGLTLAGILNLLYGYNLGANLSEFNGISNHQFTLIFNLNKYSLEK